MIRYLRILRVCLAISVQLDLEYRASFLVNTVNSLLGIGAGLAIIYALFQRGSALGGWSFSEVVTLFGAFSIADAMVDIVLRPSLGRVPELVQRGSMDYMLLKPVNLQFLVSLRSWNMWSLPNLLFGIAITLYGMSASGALGLGNLLLFALMMSSGLVVIYALWASLAITAFWFVRVGNAHLILFALLGAGRFPITAYPAWLRLIFTFVVPVAFVTTVPAAAAVGRLDWMTAAASLVAAGISLGVSAVIWRLAARSYTSASS